MKNNIFICALCAICMSPLLSLAQELPQRTFNLNEETYERPDNPYLPNAYNNHKLSPAYRYDSRNQSRNNNSEIFTRQVNVSPGQQNIIGDAANEPNIAVNPLNENEIVIGWRQFNNVLSNFRQAGWAYSSDGGETWTFPGSILPGVFQSDPVLDFDNNGNLYYNALVSSPQGDLPCFVYKSTNSGASWGNGVHIGGGDKQWMAVDRTGGIGDGNIYSAWSPLFTSCPPGFFTRSTDEGKSWESCSVITDEISWGTQTVGNNGELYVCGRTNTTAAIRVAKSVNAEDPSESTTWDTVTTCNLGGFITAGLPINPEGLTGQAYIDVDRSNGPGRNNVYIAASVSPYFILDPADVMFNKSTDGGLTWNNASPVRINDDPDTTNTQWFATMSVAPNGRIDVIWLDTRDHPGTDSSALYYSYSHDQGETWSANEKLSESFDPHVGYPNQAKMGDYFDMESKNEGVHLAWVHTLNGSQDVYYSFISPPALTSAKELYGGLNVSVYPNPTTGKFEVAGSENAVSIEVFSALGTNVFSSSAFSVRHTIDISSQPAGIYFIKIISEDSRSSVVKVVRE